MEYDQARIIARLKRWMNKNRPTLEEAGVAVIVGVYGGSGDEGSFEGSQVRNSDGFSVDFKLPEKIEGLIEALANELATSGYENDDGGGGEIRLIVETGVITHESWFYTVERSSDGIEEY